MVILVITWLCTAFPNWKDLHYKLTNFLRAGPLSYSSISYPLSHLSYFVSKVITSQLASLALV